QPFPQVLQLVVGFEASRVFPAPPVEELPVGGGGFAAVHAHEDADGVLVRAASAPPHVHVPFSPPVRAACRSGPGRESCASAPSAPRSPARRPPRSSSVRRAGAGGTLRGTWPGVPAAPPRKRPPFHRRPGIRRLPLPETARPIAVPRPQDVPCDTCRSRCAGRW